jgi:hypothetical protein
MLLLLLLGLSEQVLAVSGVAVEKENVGMLNDESTASILETRIEGNYLRSGGVYEIMKNITKMMFRYRSWSSC